MHPHARLSFALRRFSLTPSPASLSVMVASQEGKSWWKQPCTALKSIDLPKSVTFIQKLAFCGCAALDAPSRERIRAICPDAVM